MRIHTVGELIQELQQLPEEMPVMAQYQPSWPLREYIGGIWVDDGKDEEDPDGCGQCGRMSLGDPVWLETEGEAHDAGWFSTCYNCGSVTETEEPKELEKVAYIVLSGSPYDESPYGSKRAWSAI